MDELIDLHIRCDTTHANGQIISKEDKAQKLRDAIKMKPLELKDINETEKTICLRFRCSEKFAYLDFFKEDGLIVNIIKTLFEMVSHLRLSVEFYSSIVEEIEKEEGKIYKMTNFIFSLKTPVV